MLRFAEGADTGSALTLRAGAPPALIVVRRVVATLLAIAVFGGGLYAAFVGSGCVTVVAVPIGGAIAAMVLLGMPPLDVRELRIGEDGSVQVVERGVYSWLTRATTLRAPLHYSAGLVPERDGPELGLALGTHDTTVYFSVAGVDRRDEARKLAHLFAARLRTGLRVVQDDAFVLVADLSEEQPAPEIAITGGAYRTAAAAPSAIDTTRRPSFEAPAQEPPRFVVGAANELRDHVNVFDPEGGRFSATMAKPEPRIFTEERTARIRNAMGQGAIWAGIAGVVGLLLGWSFDRPVAGLGIGAALGFVAPIVAWVASEGSTAAGTAIGAFLAGAFIALRGREPLRPGTFARTAPRGWTLAVKSGEIELRGRLITRRVPLTKARALAIVADAVGREHALWLKLGRRWVRLLRTRWLPGHDRPAIERMPALASIAVEIARALDVPIRYVP